jgi:hypothetical protein
MIENIKSKALKTAPDGDSCTEGKAGWGEGAEEALKSTSGTHWSTCFFSLSLLLIPFPCISSFGTEIIKITTSAKKKKSIESEE